MWPHGWTSGRCSFLDKELPIDFPRGTTREVDVVARQETHQGAPEIVLVHVEVQSRPEKDFARRMSEYSALLTGALPVSLCQRGAGASPSWLENRPSLWTSCIAPSVSTATPSGTLRFSNPKRGLSSRDLPTQRQPQLDLAIQASLGTNLAQKIRVGTP